MSEGGLTEEQNEAIEDLLEVVTSNRDASYHAKILTPKTLYNKHILHPREFNPQAALKLSTNRTNRKTINTVLEDPVLFYVVESDYADETIIISQRPIRNYEVNLNTNTVFDCGHIWAIFMLGRPWHFYAFESFYW